MKHDHKQSVRLWLELARIVLPMSREMDKMLRSRFSQSLVRFDLMSQLARHEAGMPVSQLADKLLAATSGNISTLLDRMIAEDLVARQPVAGDRRMTLINLTAKGRRLFDEMSIVHAEWIAGQLSGLPASDKRAAITMLGQMQDKLAGPPAHKLAS